MAQANGGEGASAPAATPLSEVFSSGSAKPAAPKDSSEPEKKKEPDKVPASDKSDSDSSPKKAEKEKPKKDETPTDDKSVRQKPDKDEKPADKKSEDKGEKKDKSDDKDASKTDADKSKDASTKDEPSKDDPYEKRWKDTQAWANKINQEKLQLQQSHERLAAQVDQLQKKLADPDYDPAQDPKYAGPTPEQIAETAIYAGKATASREAAIREAAKDFDGDLTKGAEKVHAEIARFSELFGKDEIVQSVVRQSKSPVHEAMAIMERYDFEQKYGSSPRQVYANIRKEVEADMRKSIRKELIEELREGKKLRDESVQGLSDSRSGNGTDTSKSKGEVTHTPLSSIFQNTR